MFDQRATGPVAALCRLAKFWDNSHDDGPFEVASLRHGLADWPPVWPSWTPTVLSSLD